MKNFSIFLIVILALVIIYLLYSNSKKTCFDLPTDDPNWGEKYWKSFHAIAERVPCSLCHDEAVEMMKFMHDTVNLKLGKKLYDSENFYKWQKKISELKVNDE